MKQLSSNFSTFLTLLTTQLKNQDPTSPMDSNQFTQQLVMYSQVEQQINTNDNLKTLIAQGTSNAAAMTTGYLGKKVSVTNGKAALIGGTANWTYNLHGAAAATQLDRHRCQRQDRLSPPPAKPASGNHTFAWDGKDNNGNQLADGTYKLTVTAADAAGGTVASTRRQRRHRHPDRHDRRHAATDHRQHGSGPRRISPRSRTDFGVLKHRRRETAPNLKRTRSNASIRPEGNVK